MTIEAKPRKASIRSRSSGMVTMGKTRAIIVKEIRVLRRNPHIWIGLVIPLVLFPIFILLRSYEQGTQEVYIIIVSLLSTGSYSLSCIGREGRTFPLLRSMPIRMSAFLRGKFSLNCAINLSVTLTFVTVLYLSRRSYLSQIWRNALVAAIASVYLSAFGTALAALFPKFDFTNPMRAASLPGLAMLYLIVFLFGVTFIGAISVSWYLAPLALIPWAGVAFVMLKLGQERLEKLDV